jgi:pimeloyl-ACP methyl ester carboxylesterase
MKESICNKVRLNLLSIVFLWILSCSGQSGYKYAPTGKLVDAGGHLLHIHMMGKGQPVVVFENGSADFSFIWDLVQPEISKITTSVSYDRAGYAWSENGPFPRTGKQIAYELHTALQNAGIKGPYILVGQSFGGFLVRSFARHYKTEVVGVVLVDALNENEKIMMRNEAVRIRDMAKGRMEPGIQNSKMGVDTVIPKEGNPVASNTAIEPPLDRLSPEDRKLQLWAQTQYSYYKAVSGEMDWSPEDVSDMYLNKGKPDYLLGDIPLIVLSKGKGNYSGLPDSIELEKQRIDLQNDLAHLSTNSKLIVDKNSGHNIHLEDPATVIEAIKQVINSFETHTRLK